VKRETGEHADVVAFGSSGSCPFSGMQQS